MKTLYVIDYWVPFPSSEHGGMFVVIASSDEECVELCIAGSWGREEYVESCKVSVVAADRFAVADSEVSRVVSSMTT